MQPDTWMTTEDTSKKHTVRLSPWLVAGLALILYAITLNHWVAFASLPWVAKVTGWDWHPTYLPWRPTLITPIYSAISYPFSVLPRNIQPLALNFLSAIFSALTLATLVRSIQLLPHDRTREQRQREGGEYSLLSGKYSWLPPVLAVIALAFSMTFWEHSTMATNEMLDLLIFAYLIRCLLEYRISQKESWITKFVFVYGLGMTNNWALLGYLPFFLVALIWIKGISFFNLRFLAKCIGFGLLGMIPYLIMAGVASSAYAGGTFWEQLRAHVAQQKNIVLSMPRSPVVVLSIPTVMALLFAGIRWPSFHGEVSAAGIMFTNFIFRLVHIVFFGFAVVYFFDFKYSPRMLAPNSSMLTFYYLAALSLGYFSGYILLVFGQPPAKVREHTPSALRGLKMVLFALPWIALVALPIGLFVGLPYKVREGNWQKIQAEHAPVLQHFADATAQSMVPNTGAVLSDDSGRLTLAQAGWERVHKSGGPVFIETASLGQGDYLRYLMSHYPKLNNIATQVPKHLSVLGEIQVLQRLPQPTYYLEPSFGAFFERFYLKPAGLVFQLLPLTPHAMLAPELTASDVSENIKAWNQVAGGPLSRVALLVTNNVDASIIAAQSSRSANYVGVQFQRQNHLQEANTMFAHALALNPQNVMARVNQDFNAHLRASNTKSVELSDEFKNAVERYGWQNMLLAFGPPDEPDLDFDFGQLIASNGYLRQAGEYLLRRIALRPNDTQAQIALAKTYVDMEQPDDAFAMLQKARSHATAADADELTRVEALAYLAKNDQAKAEELLKTAAAKNDNYTGSRLAMLAEFYRVIGYNAARANRATEAKTSFNNALSTLDRELKWFSAPDRARTSDADIADVLMRKAEIQMQLGSHDQAIASLNKALDLQPGNPRALMNRAIAQLQAGKYDEAKRDYNELDRILPQPNYAVYYGLAEIATKTNDRSGAIKNFKKYLKYAPENSNEAKQVRERLDKLERGA
jgi:tetratricopeptide (TPR) repeat protein